jgi:hypothetical protein
MLDTVNRHAASFCSVDALPKEQAVWRLKLNAHLSPLPERHQGRTHRWSDQSGVAGATATQRNSTERLDR